MKAREIIKKPNQPEEMDIGYVKGMPGHAAHQDVGHVEEKQ